MLPTGKAKLYWLIRLCVSGHHDVGTFCKEFETTYNFEVDKAELSAAERLVFRELFDRVVLYSPLKSDLETYPLYQSAQKIGEAVAAAQSKLDFKVETGAPK
jgi:hypothetical protein